MKITDLEEHVEHFRTRVLADALQEATCAYWRRRADAFAAALPRPTDYTGRATAAEIEAQRYRVAAVVLACRERAGFMLGGEIE